MTDRARALKLLRDGVGDQSVDFRDGQWEAIDTLVNRHGRLLLVQRTGWGKSQVYFIATRILRERGRGPTLIVSPLLALMRNQSDAANRMGVRADTINSTNRSDWDEIHRRLNGNEADVLLVSPERLANDEFVEKVLLPNAGTIGMLVVDEAHCISDWGHDFRPDYRRLLNILQHMPANVPILATTATANNRVIKDVREQLGNLGIRRGPLIRESLALQTMRQPLPASTRLAWLAEHLGKLPGTGIVYTLTKHDADQVAEWLRKQNIHAKAYYSGVTDIDFDNSNDYRQHLEELLLNNKLKALVATTALGMGYDKSDLGFVVHYQAPSSIVTYYQQVGRAGRGIDFAVGVLLTGDEDGEIQEYFRRSAFPHADWVRKILDVLTASDGLSVREMETRLNLHYGQIEKALKFLAVENPAPVIYIDKKWRRTPTSYNLDTGKIRRLTEQRELEWEEVQSYINERGCLMQFLAKALDDPDPRPCGKCSTCLNSLVVESTFSRDKEIWAEKFLGNSESCLKPRKQLPSNAFHQYQFGANLPPKLQARTGRILSRFGVGWGQNVAQDKENGHFSDELVTAVAEMIRERWGPKPSPEWVTCVPSQNNRTLVPDFANRLATRLNLPFMTVVIKMRNNQPQKEQQNRYHQCRNLDGAFEVREPFPHGPVLLVDDIVDSGWTLTVIAALLLRSGSGPVFPVALASAKPG